MYTGRAETCKYSKFPNLLKNICLRCETKKAKRAKQNLTPSPKYLITSMKANFDH